MRHKSYFLVFFLGICVPMLAGAVEEIQEVEFDISNIEEETVSDEGLEISDPLETVNRSIFYVNKSLDKLIIRPATVTYRELVPDWGKDRVHSAVFNMYEPVRIGNSILQANEDMIAKTAGRFLTNTILGFGGLIDVAAEADPTLKPQTTDFGLTLKNYGVGKGPFLMLPLLGPSTVRDTVGMGADFFMDPFNSRLFHKDFKIARTATAALDKRYNLLEVTDHLESTSLDEYSATRSMYLQQR